MCWKTKHLYAYWTETTPTPEAACKQSWHLLLMLICTAAVLLASIFESSTFRSPPKSVRNVQTPDSVPKKLHLNHFRYGQLHQSKQIVLESTSSSCSCLWETYNLIQAQAKWIHLSTMRRVSLTNQQFPTLETTALIHAGFLTLSINEDGACHGDLNIQHHDVERSTEQAVKPSCKVERVTEAGTEIGNKQGVTSTFALSWQFRLAWNSCPCWSKNTPNTSTDEAETDFILSNY